MFGIARTQQLLLTVGVVGVVGAGIAVAVVHGHNTAGTKVLGEKVTGSGTGTTSPKASGQPNGNGQGNGNGNGNGGNPPGKTFSIFASSVTLYPGGTAHVNLSVHNNNNQAIRITSLSAKLTGVTKAAGAPLGSCPISDATVVSNGWTGSAFTVAPGATSAVPGSIELAMPADAADACQGADFVITYAGEATQA